MNCSFCGRDRDEVEHLVSGPGVLICNACVELCRDVLAQTPASRIPPGGLVAFDRTRALAVVEALADIVERHVAAQPAIARVGAWQTTANQAVAALRQLAGMITVAHFADYQTLVTPLAVAVAAKV